MKALRIDEPVHLDEKSINTLATLLATKITNVHEFWDLPDDEHTFVELVTDWHLPGRVLIDWKWSPAELFEELENALSGHSINLLRVEDDDIYVAYRVRFNIDGKTVELSVNSAEPNLLIEKINDQLNTSEFIEIDLGGDEFAWILTPKSSDLIALAELVGFRYADSITVKHDGFPTRQSLQPTPFTEHFDINQPLANKITVNLVMRHRVNGILQMVVVKDGQGNHVPYQFEVEAGQQYIETMKQALKDDIGYEGVVELHKPQLISDPQASSVPVYETQVYLAADVPANAGSGKYQVTLEETAEIY